MDPPALSFFQNFRLEPSGTWIDQKFQEVFLGAAATAAWPVELSGCPFMDVGSYLLRVLHVLATLSESLANGEVISSHFDSRMQELEAEHDFRTANLLDDKHASLRIINDKLRQTLLECAQEWTTTLSQPTNNSSQTYTDTQLQGYSVSPGTEVASSSSLPDPVVTEHLHSDLGSSTSPSQDFASSSAWYVSPEDPESQTEDMPSIEQLKVRGRGQYTCPHGAACEKGGVQPDGQLTVYERNSTFRAHLQLHERLYRCDLPGCTNKKGFARVDQLERHKATTRHRAPTEDSLYALPT